MADRRDNQLDDQKNEQQRRQDEQRDRDKRQGEGDRGFERQGQSANPGQGGEQGGQGVKNPRRDQDEDDEMGASRNPRE